MQDQQHVENFREIFRAELEGFIRKKLKKATQTSARQREFYLQICQLDSDQPLFMSLCGTFDHYLDYANRLKLDNSAFLGLLIDVSVKCFLKKNDGMRVSYDGRIKGKEDPYRATKIKFRTRLLNHLKPIILGKLEESQRAKADIFSPMFSAALKKPVIDKRLERQQEGVLSVFDKLHAKVQKKETQRKEMQSIILAYFSGTKNVYFLLVRKQSKRVQVNHRFGDLFPEAFKLSLTADLCAGPDSLIAKIFREYAARKGFGKSFPVVGKFFADLIESPEIHAMARCWAALVYLSFAIEYFLTGEFSETSKFTTSAFIGSLIITLSKFLLSPVDLEEFNKLKIKLDQGKSFSKKDRKDYLGKCLEVLKKIIADLNIDLGAYANAKINFLKALNKNKEALRVQLLDTLLLGVKDHQGDVPIGGEEETDESSSEVLPTFSDSQSDAASSAVNSSFVSSTRQSQDQSSDATFSNIEFGDFQGYTQTEAQVFAPPVMDAATKVREERVEMGIGVMVEIAKAKVSRLSQEKGATTLMQDKRTASEVVLGSK